MDALIAAEGSNYCTGKLVGDRAFEARNVGSRVVQLPLVARAIVEKGLPKQDMPVTAPLSRAAEFKESLHSRILVADGAMGTALYSRGIFLNRCYDELNLSLPAPIRDVHQDYVRAGAEIIETNTFGANRKRLAAFGFAEKMREINLAGVRLAREAAGELAFLAGAVGPLGVRIEPLGSTTFAEARTAFREQFDALAGSRRRPADPRNVRRSGRTARGGARGARSGGKRYPA